MLALLITLASALGATAQGVPVPPPPATNPLDARSLEDSTLSSVQAQAAVERGHQAFLAHRPDEAVAAFREAVTLEPTPRTWRRLAVTLRATGRYSESLEAFEHYLAAPEANVTAALLLEVRQMVVEMRHSLARLLVTLEPREASLLIDARPRNIDAAGLTLDPGTHVLEVRAEGYTPLRREVTLELSGQLVLVLRLERMPGRISVEPSVAGAMVTIDGLEAGRGRVERELAPGEHDVRVAAPDFEPYRSTIRIGAGAVVRVPVTMARRRAAWVVPTLVVSGVVVLATGGALLAAYLTRGTTVPTPSDWAIYYEAIRVR